MRRSSRSPRPASNGLAWLPALLFLPSIAGPASGGEPSRRAFSIEDLLSIRRVSDPQVSPDGKFAAYTIRTPSLEKNNVTGHIWIVPAAGGEPRQLTNHEKGEGRPRWSPDGKTIAFLSSRGGSQQVWLIPVDGGEARQLTSLSAGADGHVWSPAGTHIAFSSDVWPDLQGDAAQKQREEEIKASGVEALVIDRLLYRHWNSYRRGKRTHVFVVPAAGGEPRDLTPGEFDSPPFSLGGPEGFAFSPDGKTLAFTRGPAQGVEAWSTNADLFTVPVEGGEPVCLTAGNKGWDGGPVWSPDGRSIAYRSQERDGYEADRFRLAVIEPATGKIRFLAGNVDASINELLWAPDGKGLYFTAEHEGSAALYRVPFEGPPRMILSGASFGSLSLPADGSFFIGEVQSLVRPAEVARLDLGAGRDGARPTAITRTNDALLAERDMPTRESVRYPGALGARIQAWLLRPPGSAPGRKLPLILFIHGGPQGAWTDDFHYRWNAALYAARGFAVLLPNFHGSTGFGQAFAEQISGDWGGACFEDLLKGVDWAVAQGIADPDRLAAMGGSFGGYMVNWILGHTDRFKALVSHAGVYNLESDYGTTEELWFPEWEMGGPPWKNRAAYEKFSPHRFAANFRTPTLVIHGELDFRVPVSEAQQLFTALQRQGVESRFLYFPDEGHWILKPRNSKLWNETVLGWIEKHLGSPIPAAAPGGGAAPAGGKGAWRIRPLHTGLCFMGKNHLLGDPFTDEERVPFSLISFLLEGPGGEMALVDFGPKDPAYFNENFRRYGLFRERAGDRRNPDDVVQPEGNVLAHLRRLGIGTDRIGHILFTHLHYDHIGGSRPPDPGLLRDFPRALVHVSRRGWDDNLARREGGWRWTSYIDFDVSQEIFVRGKEGRARMADGEEVLPGLRTRYLGGHSICSQAVLADTADGTAVIAGDVVYHYEYLEKGIVARLRTTAEEYIEAIRRVAALVEETGGVLVPVHDPKVLEACRSHGERWLQALREESDRAVRGFRARAGSLKTLDVHTNKG